MALSAFESIFKDDPFFEQASFVWPLQRTPLTSRLMQDGRSLREDFFNRRAHLVRSLSNQMSSGGGGGRGGASSASSLLGELCQGLPLPTELLHSLDQLQLRARSSSPASSIASNASGSGSPAPASPAPSTPTPSHASPSPSSSSSMGMVSMPAASCTALQPAFDRDSTLTLNAQGFTPDDIRVTVSGRQLEVMATKRAESADSASMSNGNVHCASASSSRRQQGFIQRVTLPEGVQADDISCSLGEDGMLRIQTKPRGDYDAWSNASTSLPPTPTPTSTPTPPTPTPPTPTPFGMEKNASFKLEDALGKARMQQQQQEEDAPMRYRTSLDFPITNSSSSPPTVETTFRKSN